MEPVRNKTSSYIVEHMARELCHISSMPFSDTRHCKPTANSSAGEVCILSLRNHSFLMVITMNYLIDSGSYWHGLTGTLGGTTGIYRLVGTTCVPKWQNWVTGSDYNAAGDACVLADVDAGFQWRTEPCTNKHMFLCGVQHRK